MWEIRLPVISTGHVTKETRDWLEHELDGSSVMGASYRFGWWIYLDDEENCDGREDLLAIRKWLLDNGYTDGWVRLDSDGDQVDDLPQYEW